MKVTYFFQDKHKCFCYNQRYSSYRITFFSAGFHTFFIFFSFYFFLITFITLFFGCRFSWCNLDNGSKKNQTKKICQQCYITIYNSVIFYSAFYMSLIECHFVGISGGFLVVVVKKMYLSGIFFIRSCCCASSKS